MSKVFIEIVESILMCDVDAARKTAATAPKEEKKKKRKKINSKQDDRRTNIRASIVVRFKCTKETPD